MGKKDRIAAADTLIWRAKNADSQQSLRCGSSEIPLSEHCEQQKPSLIHGAGLLFAGRNLLSLRLHHFPLFFSGSEVGIGGIFPPWGLKEPP